MTSPKVEFAADYRKVLNYFRYESKSAVSRLGIMACQLKPSEAWPTEQNLLINSSNIKNVFFDEQHKNRKRAPTSHEVKHVEVSVKFHFEIIMLEFRRAKFAVERGKSLMLAL